MLRAMVVCSRQGSVINRLLDLDYVRQRIVGIVSDRECGAMDVARRHGLPATVLPAASGQEFSDHLLNHFSLDTVDVFISFYTRLFRGRFLNAWEGRLINLHPSILPACPGMAGFEDTVASGAAFIGGTIHFIDSGMDTGKPIIQSARPFDPQRTVAENRHLVFIQQCKMLLQVINWFDAGRIVYRRGERVLVRGAHYDVSEFAPNLDFLQAINFDQTTVSQ